MPSIKITEIDATSGGGSSTNLNVVYVPGFTNNTNVLKDEVWAEKKGETGVSVVDKSDAAPAMTPTLCTTKDEFEMYFGKKPAKWEENGKTIYDKSYIYAKELISAGIPVLYESVNGADTAPSLISMYSALMGDIFSDERSSGTKGLSDLGEYSFKYLTSGGYPSFGYSLGGSAMVTFKSGEVDSLPAMTKALSDKSIITLTNGKPSDITIEFRCTEILSDGVAALRAFYEETDIGFSAFASKVTNTSNDYAIKVEIDPQGGAPIELFKISTPYGVAIGDKLIFKYQATTSTKGEFESSKGAAYVIYNTLFEYKMADAKQDITYQVDEAGIETAIAGKMVDLAEKRGDCVALIDHSNSSKRPLVGSGSVYTVMSDWAKDISGEYAAAFTPWCSVSCTTYKPEPGTTETIDFVMPPSFCYLSAFAKSIKTNASWIAVAGATRGQVPNFVSLNTEKVLTNSIAESVYQNRGEESSTGISINAITNIKPYGHRIWGNRTLKDNTIEGNLTATSFLNIRNMICDVKKVVYAACKRYTFEQNNDVLWLNFKAAIEPTLNQMKTGAGLSGYKIIKEETKEKAKLVATIKLFPLYAVEDFEITVKMEDDEVSVG